MADLSIGEVGKVLQLNLINVDTTQSPPVSGPLDLTNATNVQLTFVIADQNGRPKSPSQTRAMTITNALNGIVQYPFVSADLVKPSDMGKDGVFRFSVQVTFTGNVVLISSEDGKLSIKDDSLL